MRSTNISYRFLLALLCGALGFILAVAHLPEVQRGLALNANGDVVLHPALLSVLYGGDRFLAANVEAVRVTTSGRLQEKDSLDFFVRLHDSVSQLNPCHEDNYYIANAFLTWGGGLAQAETTLSRAIKCRFWDAWPAFMQGFNQYFFAHDTQAAAASLEVAARRSSGKESVFYGTLAISFRAADFDDLGAAIKYLSAEQTQAKDDALKGALGKRILRLQGLSVLRKAQADFQEKYQAPLREPQQLLRAGILKAFPPDPLGVGYEFTNGRFELKQIAIAK